MKISVFNLIIIFSALIFGQSVDPIYITLNGDITDPNQEISGLAWHGDDLILLPQYPNDKIFSIPKTQILAFLDSTKSTILPQEIIWDSSNLDRQICGFEGFEAIVFDRDTVYITIEAEQRNKNMGFVARGIIKNKTIKINANSLKKVDTPVFLQNLTYETVLLGNEAVITIYETNAVNVNPNPIFYKFDKQLKSFSSVPFPFPNIKYRITDATEIDSSGKFWVTNYFWPGDFTLLQLETETFKKSHAKPIERLLEFQLLEDKIIRTARPPINLLISEFGDSRNWEGIVRLDNLGFLIVTDKFPGTILAFVPFSE